MKTVSWQFHFSVKHKVEVGSRIKKVLRDTFSFSQIFTGRNEVVAKVMFLQVCVCPQGGGCLPQCMLGCQAPPPDWVDTPGLGRHPPGNRQTTPQTRQTPPRTRQTPPGKQTPVYGLRAAGIHPTGMHSCCTFVHCIRLKCFPFVIKIMEKY